MERLAGILMSMLSVFGGAEEPVPMPEPESSVYFFPQDVNEPLSDTGIPSDATVGNDIPVIDPIWFDLADCESGDRRNGVPVDGSARWWYGDPSMEHPAWGLTLFHGGLQFLPSTWSWVAPMVLDDPPEFAWQASVYEQVLVAERTQELQGWQAWPNCSRIIGLLD